MRHRLLFLIAVTFSFFGPTPAMAQPSGAHGENFLYRVVAGDTLIHLAERFTDNESNWKTLQTLNSVLDPYQMGIGIELKIPFALIPELPSQAHVSHLAGLVHVDNKPISIDAQIAEGSKLRTSTHSFATLALADGSVLSVPAASSLQIERLRVFKGTGLIDTIFVIENGSLESNVAPQKTGVGRFQVRTPISITGVRGTRLRVRVSEQGSQSEVLSGRAHLSSSQANDTSLRQGQGAAITQDGQLLPVRPLLPAPQLPQAEQQGRGRSITFPAIPNADAYLVRVASDAAGSNLVSSKIFNSPEINFSAPGPGTYYAVVRAIDADGVMGHDAVLPFSGQSVLSSSDGSPVSSGHGQFVRLTDF
ncbi:FecR domain-containing protein [Alcaligenaceae bacterium]|nr:FecR domain-containing protein [Alcaligenaceae bacterium]